MITKFKVIREQWSRGAMPDSRLLNSSDKMCCLGFLCKAIGYSDRDIDDKYSPDEITRPKDPLYKHWPEQLRPILMYEDQKTDKRPPMIVTDLMDEIMGVNDRKIGEAVKCHDFNQTVIDSEATREVVLTGLFAKANLVIEFE